MPKLMGTEVKHYRYYDAKNICVDFEGMKADFESAKEGSVMLI
jgi:aspartate/tyrosine/aromatic aminotransferase